ncbi:MAG: hypothetical protein QOI69_1763 [Pseudonocardiales bacterium]|nr:hypothetical protein [Pseudonocardiales bacterium]
MKVPQRPLLTLSLDVDRRKRLMMGSGPGLTGDRKQLVADVCRRLALPGAGVTIVGEAGIGKTTVWSEALAEYAAEWRWTAQCLSVEADLGLAVLADLFTAAPDDVITSLPRPQRHALDVVLFRDEDTGAASVGNRMLGAVLLSVLRGLAGRGSVLLGIDDVQWCDPTSFDALSYAAHRLGDAPVALMTTRRAGTGRDLPDCSQVTVDPLEPTVMAGVVRSTVGSIVPDDVVAAIVERSGGNPFFARELARQWTADPNDRRLPGSVREVLARRLDSVDATTRSMLVDVAVRGAPAEAALQPSDLGRAVDADLLHVDEGRVRFTHPLLAAAVIDGALSAELRAAHERAAAAAGADDVAAVLHRVQYEPPSEELVADLDAAATVALRRGDRAGARNLAEYALNLTPGGRRPSARLLRLVELESGLGHEQRAKALADELREVADTPSAHATALLCMDADDWDGEIGKRRKAAAIPGLSEAFRQRIASDLAAVMLNAGRTNDAMATLERALAGVTDARDFPELVGEWAFTKRIMGLSDDGILLEQTIERGRALWALSNDTSARVYSAIGTAGVIAMLDDRHDEASRLLAEAADGAARSGELEISGYYRALLPCRTGHLDDAVTLLRQTFAADGPNPRGPARIALAHLWRGEVSQAQACIDQARELTLGWPSRDETEINFAIGFLALLAAKFDDAWPALQDAAAQLDAMSYREPSHPPVLPAAVEAAAALGLLDEARALCARLERDSAGLRSRFGLAAVARSRGFIALADGDHDRAQACFDEAADAFLRLGVPLEAARTYLALGSLLRRDGQRRRGREALSTARMIFDVSGAAGLVRDCDVELAKISGRVASGSSQLTKSERQVADLVATGMRNVDVAHALNLSIKTVETHLGSVYRKLGVANRTELSTRIDAPAASTTLS